MSRRWRYDVFVSFLEKDTGNTITGHLFEALHQMGIVGFKPDNKVVGDQEDYEQGEELELKAIDESKTCIVVLSKDYASSTKCLRELANIMERRSETKITLRVLPLFYHVDPSHVRHQTGSFEKHFHQHTKTHAEEVLTWRDAMEKVANLSGSVVYPTSDEAEIIKKMTHQVFSALLCGLTTSNENLVGISRSFKEVYEHLDMKSDEVRFLGIVGMGGIGKTTLAEAIYHKISDEFDGSCFLRISGSDTRNKIPSLQNQLLSTIFKNEKSFQFQVWDEDQGVEEIKRLHCKKVLLVVDGAEKDFHITKLAATPDWFGPGSRVIITSRNKDLLLDFPKLEIPTYEVHPLEEDDSLQLFCTYAFSFEQHYYLADANYSTLCESIVKHASGLPLALKVLGSALRGRPLGIWQEILESLGQVSDKKIVDILKISYDALEARQREIFLDIACFFKGKNIDRVSELLESFGHHQVMDEVELLMNRCLIDLLNKRIMMHDLIQDMGREIVRRESSTQFGKQSRIWLRDDMKRVSVQQYGVEETRGIVFDLEEGSELEMEAMCISKMTKLRILEINHVHLNQELEYLSNLLGFLNWPGCPSKCLPPTFQPANLIELRMPCSHILQLWDGTKKFGSLKLIDLSDSKNLLKTPDLSGVLNLESLVLRGCTSLREIHSSVSRLNRLAFLDLKDCSNLKTFSSKIACRKLKTFILSGCSSLENFPEIEGKMEHLEKLYLDGTAIRNLHSSIGRLTGLVLLNLRDCKRLSSLPSNVIGKFKSLRTLILHGCSLLDLIEFSSDNANCLEELDLSETSLTQVPPSIHFFNNLKVLRCQGLFNSIWHSLNSPSFGLLSLTSLDLSNCNLVDENIPQDLHNFSSLQVLDVSGNHFVRLGGDSILCQLRSLKKLYLHNCTMLQRLPQLFPSSLQSIEGRDCVSIAQTFYNKELSIPSARVGFLSIKFPISNEEQNFRFVDMDDIFSTENRMSKQRYIEMKASDREEFELSSELDHLFECFEHKEKGNTIEFCCNNPYASSSYDKRFDAIALAVGINMTKLAAFGKLSRSNFMIRLETDGYPPKRLRNVEKECGMFSRAKVCVFYIPFEKLSEEVRNEDFRYIKASITCKNPDIKVEKCGASVLFGEDVVVFLRNMLSKCFQNRPMFTRVSKDRGHLLETYVEVEDPDQDDFSSTEDSSSEHSIILLKRSLKSIIRRTFEEPNVLLAPLFIFPRKEMSISWFKHQQEQTTLTIMLPLYLHKDKKWMGLALFVVFSVEGHLGRHHTFSYDIDGGEIQYGHSPSIKMPKYLVDEDSSHQVCVIFQSRESFSYDLNYSDYIQVIITTDPGVKVVSCGARLVYQQNVKGLIETIVDCVCQSPPYLHDYLATMILASFLTSITALGDTEPPGVQKEDEIELIMKDPFRTMFDCFLYGLECLSLFAFQKGNNVKMKLPQGLCLNVSWMGFVTYALITLNRANNDHVFKQPLKLVDLICKFEADSDIIEPEHFLITSEDDLLEGGADQFVWLFYVPRTELHIVWRHCNYFGASMVTNRPELLSVRECGIQIVGLQDKEIIQEWAASSLQNKQHASRA